MVDMKRTEVTNIDEYIADYPGDVQKLLQRIRKIIRKAAPGAKEAIKYGIPTFVLNRNLIHFAAYKKHIGLYPAPRGVEKFKKELANYEGGKGTIQFPLDQPIPFELITRIVVYRVSEDAKKAKNKNR
jgi:uncharacterized protein YdhG (YjbR/CyaY superfamily)